MFSQNGVGAHRPSQRNPNGTRDTDAPFALWLCASANMMGAPNAPPGHKDQLYLNVRCCSASRQAETLQPGGTASGMGRVNALLSPP